MTEKNNTIKSLTAYNMIRERILTGELLPGTRLVLADLEEKLGVGRGPVREAIMRLDKTGLVKNIPYKGAVVNSPPSFKEMETIYETRVLIETTMAMEAMQAATEKDIFEIELISSDMKKSYQDDPLFFHVDREFHSKIYSISKMNHLQSIVDRLLDHAEIFLNTRYYTSEDKNLFLQQHDAIIEAIKVKDKDVLCETLKENILVGLDLVKSEMERFHRKPLHAHYYS